MGAGGHPVVPQMPAGGSAGEAVVGVLVRRGLGLDRGPDLVVRELGAPASAGVVDQDGAGRSSAEQDAGTTDTGGRAAAGGGAVGRAAGGGAG